MLSMLSILGHAPMIIFHRFTEANTEVPALMSNRLLVFTHWLFDSHKLLTYFFSRTT